MRGGDQMTDSIDALSVQVQTNMLRALLQTRASGSAGGLDSASDSSGLSFENLLQGCISQLEGESAGVSDYSDMSALLEGMGVLSNAVAGSGQAGASETQPDDSLVNFVAAHEGYSGTVYSGADYQNQTIGYGHVITPGEDYTSLTQDQAKGLLKDDLSSSVASVSKEFGGTNLSQNQLDALVSFAYNLGNNIWSSAPKLVSDIKSGASADTLKADFTQFDHCNGKEIEGLYNRRVDEWSLFTSGYQNQDA
jgi:GH24 family phage-related lysozyme (muramidase)